MSTTFVTPKNACQKLAPSVGIENQFLSKVMRNSESGSEPRSRDQRERDDELAPITTAEYNAMRDEMDSLRLELDKQKEKERARELAKAKKTPRAPKKKRTRRKKKLTPTLMGNLDEVASYREDAPQLSHHSMTISALNHLGPENANRWHRQ